MSNLIASATKVFKSPFQALFVLPRFFADRIERERLRNQLHMMSNRDLDDIGINRGDINNVVRGNHSRCKFN